MQSVHEKAHKALRALIRINNDRYEGYKTAAEETKDTDLKSIFNKLSLQSKGYSNDLQNLITYKEMAPETDETTLSGKLYRIWMDIKSAVTAKDRKAILASCEFGEDVARKTYEEVLDDPEDLTPEMLAVIRKQRSEIQQGHDTIKAMRDGIRL